MLRPYFDFDRDPLDTQVATEIRLDQDADGPAAELRGKFAARRADPAFPPERDGAPPRADGAFGDRSLGRTANRAEHVGFGDRPGADVVQKAVIGLADDRIRRADIFVAWQREEPGEHGVGRARHTQGAGQYDRRLKLAQLIHLRRAHELAEAVPDDDRCRNFLTEWISAVRQNRGDACVDRVAARNRRLPAAHAGDIRNGVEGTGRYGTYYHAAIASTGPGAGLGGTRAAE